MTKSDKTRKKDAGAAMKLRNAAIQAKAIQGQSGQEIAKEMGLSYQHVSKILNSAEMKAKVKEIDARLAALVDDAIETVRIAVTDRGDLGTAYRAARDVLKNFGSMKDNVNVNLSLPKPLVIERRNGTQIVLGTEADKEDEN